MRTLLVHQGEKPLIGILEDGQLAEVFFPQEGDTAEAVLLGRVERIVPGMKAAFVDIGQEKNGFLPLEEKNTGLSYPKTGDAVIVQIRKEAQGVKGAFLTRDISLCGETMLLTPMSRMVGVSSKITEDGKRKALKETGRAIAQERFGLVMRTAAENAPEEELAAEAERLFQQWEQIRRAAPTAHVPSVLMQPRSTLEAVLDDYRPRGIDQIVTDDPAVAEKAAGIAPVQVIPENLLTIYKIESQLKKAQERRVWLSSGGTLVIDPCEAMTVIDVNTAKFTGKRELEDTVLRLNLECADYTVTAFDNGLAAWNALAADHDYDLALLDMMLPGVDGFTLLPKLQEYGIPVICLTAMNDAQHEVQGLRGGAEDYIAKPFDMLALMVRMEKVLRRSGKFREVYHFRDLTLDNGNRRISRNGEEIPLPPLEFDVLAVLMKNKNRTVSRERILNEIWGQDYFGDIRTVDVRIANLRKKLNLSEEIRTISKAGYRLEER